MAFTRLPDDFRGFVPGGPEEYRRKVQQAREERLAARRGELEAQASPMKEPQERIDIWERLHGLRLPESPEHPLVEVIARQTHLAISQVHEEQRRRAAAR
jgi:hypothetical protein